MDPDKPKTSRFPPLFWSCERVNKRQVNTVTTLTAHRRIAHQAAFVNGVIASSWRWHSRALDTALWPLGGLDSGQGGPVVSTAPL